MVTRIIKQLIAVGFCVGLMMQSVWGDTLKNVLSNKLRQHDDVPGMVNLDALNHAAPIKPQSRPSKAVVATVNGKKIIKKEADAYLFKRTKGKVKDFDLLPKPQRLALIKEIALPMLLAEGAKKELSQEEKDAVLSRAWMQKEVEGMQISDAELTSAYERIKAEAKAKSALSQVPSFEAIKDRLKMQIAQQKVIGDLMRGAQVRPGEGSEGIAGYVGMMAISIDEVNKMLNTVTKGKMTWATLPAQERVRVLQMAAPSKFVSLAAQNGLTRKEKDNVLSNYWIQKSLSHISVSDAEAKKRYEKLKILSKKAKSKKKLPDYATLEKTLKMQIANEKFVKNLTQKAHIKLK